MIASANLRADAESFLTTLTTSLTVWKETKKYVHYCLQVARDADVQTVEQFSRQPSVRTIRAALKEHFPPSAIGCAGVESLLHVNNPKIGNVYISINKNAFE